MGEVNPKFIDLECKDCSTRFRLRATKGRLPTGPVECPSCHVSIAIESPPTSEKAPRPKTSQRASRSTKATQERRVNTIPTLTEESNPSTLTGIALQHDDTLFDDFPAPTATDEMFPGDIDAPPPEVKKRTKKMFALEQPTESDHNNRTKAPWESVSTRTFKPHTVHTALTHAEKTRPKVRALTSPKVPVEPAVIEAPAAAIAPTATAPEPSADDSSEKPKLSELLKQVREKRGTTVGLPPQAIASTSPAIAAAVPTEKTKPTSRIPMPPSLSGLFQLPPAEKNEKTEKPTLAPPPIAGLQRPAPKPEPDLRRTPFGKARAETVVRTLAAHGMAAEQTGSGFIRIPSAEILDLIGQGTFRLNVEGIIYEPIDEEGIRRLIVSGALGGDERIATRGGEWSPLREHRIFRRATRATDSEPGPLTEEIDLSVDGIVEAPVEPPVPAIPAVPSDTSGEMFPTTGFISADKSAEFQKAFSGEIRLPEPSGLHNAARLKTESSGVANLPDHSPTESTDVARDDDAPTHLEEPPHDDTPISADAAAETVEPTPRLHDRVFDPTEEVTTAAKTSAPVPPQKSKLFIGILAAVALTGVLVGGVILPAMQSTSAETEPTPTAAVEQSQEPVAPSPVGDTATQAIPPKDTPVVETTVASAEKLPVEEIAAPDVAPENIAPPDVDSVAEPADVPAVAVDIASATTGANLANITVQGTRGAGVVFESQGRIGTFYPHSTTAHRAHRAIIAIRALCEATKCGVAFAPTQNAVVPKASLPVFEGLKADGDEVQGVVIWEVPGAAQLPLAPLTTLWRKWMALPLDQHQQPLSSYRAELVKALGDTRADALIAQAQNINVGQLVRQISNVLVLDFLTNNFDRFEATADHWNLGLKDGVVVSLDDSGAFQARASTRIKGRFSWATRFDQTVFLALSKLTPDGINDMLLPEPTGAEKVALKVFWKQHEAYVQRLNDALQRDPQSVFF